MIGFTAKIDDSTKRVKNAMDRAAFKNIGHAAASIRKEAAASIKTSPEPAKAGSPPHTRRGQLRRAIRFAVDRKKQEAIVGPEFSKVGLAGEAHEFGKSFRGTDYDERPYMGRSLAANLDRFARSFKHSIGG